MSLKVLRSGPDSLVVTKPKQGFRHFGVPPSGPIDSDAALISNLLIGNERLETCVEVGPFGIELIVIKDCHLAIAGADRSVTLEGVPVACNGVIGCSTDQVLRIGPVARGARSYVSVNGGFSTVNLEAGSNLDSLSGRDGVRPRILSSFPPSLDNAPLRVVEGPEAESGFEELCRRLWSVSPLSSRQGIRLIGDAMPHSMSLPSEPQAFGVIQLPPEGQPILLGPDGPTLGGYPKIAVVCEADLSRMGQLMPGMEVSFEPISYEQARKLAIEKEMQKRQWVAFFKSTG